MKPDKVLKGLKKRLKESIKYYKKEEKHYAKIGSYNQADRYEDERMAVEEVLRDIKELEDE